MKIRPVGAELFHADGQTDRQTDMTKLIAAFRNFADVPKIVQMLRYLCHILTWDKHSLYGTLNLFPN
jgi:hypothetical protein